MVGAENEGFPVSSVGFAQDSEDDPDNEAYQDYESDSLFQNASNGCRVDTTKYCHYANRNQHTRNSYYCFPYFIRHISQT